MNEKLLKEVFLYDIVKDKDEFYLSDKDIAYYTSAGTLYSILKNKQLWLRSTMCMNDYQEIIYASNILMEFLRKNNGMMFNQFIKCLGQIIPQKISDIKDFLNNELANISNGLYLHTYIICFSEHNDKKFPDGNLQMFNSYGRGNGACLVFDRDKIRDLDLPIYKVNYYDQKIIEQKLNQLLDRLEDKVEVLCKLDSKDIINYIQLFLINIIATTKHPGFQQECEWRLVINDKLIIYDENFHNAIHEKIQCINDVPQIIKTLNICGHEDLLRKIILEPRYERTAEILAISKMLKQDWHIDNSADIIRASAIPIRK